MVFQNSLIGSEVPLTYGIVLCPRTDSARGVVSFTDGLKLLASGMKRLGYPLDCGAESVPQYRVPKGGGGGGPWSPGALKFLLWSPEPFHFTDWSPDPFLAVEPGAQRHFARSPEPSIFKFDHSSSQIALILDYCLFVFVCAC